MGAPPGMGKPGHEPSLVPELLPKGRTGIGFLHREKLDRDGPTRGRPAGTVDCAHSASANEAEAAEFGQEAIDFHPVGSLPRRCRPGFVGEWDRIERGEICLGRVGHRGTGAPG